MKGYPHRPASLPDCEFTEPTLPINVDRCLSQKLTQENLPMTWKRALKRIPGFSPDIQYPGDFSVYINSFAS